MRVIGLTVTGARVEAHLGKPAEEEDQAHVIRRWARAQGHVVQAVLDLRSSEWPVFNAFTTGAIQAVVLYTDALADHAEPPPLWVTWLSHGFRYSIDGHIPTWGMPTVIAADTGRTIDRIRGRQLEALAAFEAPPAPSGEQLQRMRQARQKKHEEGGYAYGAPPFGWAAVGGRLAPDSGEQRTLLRALELRAAGMTLRAICQVLDDEGRSSRSGAPWSSGALSRILERPAPPAEHIWHQVGTIVRLPHCNGHRPAFCSFSKRCDVMPVVGCAKER
ncbi:recombinase family protein [Streptomyces sp. NPDC001930]|uniref:recombinase family protein n=1 Tax=Streptomyces sp. NPDC001930 TaxID=3364625 RepID=UPI0036751C8A